MGDGDDQKMSGSAGSSGGTTATMATTITEGALLLV
jgi:hypothetical protein